MPIRYTADVFCDGPNCSQWIEGVTSEIPPKKLAAWRAHAAKSHWIRYRGKYYCPACVADAKRENYSAFNYAKG